MIAAPTAICTDDLEVRGPSSNQRTGAPRRRSSLCQTTRWACSAWQFRMSLNGTTGLVVSFRFS